MRLKNSDVHKSKGYFSILSETYHDFAENTSIHGLKYTVSSDVGPYERAFWILVTFSGLCGAIYMTILFWDRYTSNPTRTTVATSYAPTTTIPFPAITICNLNLIMASRVDEFLKKLDYNETEESIIRNAIPQLLSFTTFTSTNMTELGILQNVLERNSYTDISLVMEEIGQNCNDMLLYCVWNTKKIPCQEYFGRSFSQDGICCSFNYLMGKHTPTLYSEYSGLTTGLRVLLNSELQEISYSHIHSSGFKVIMHYPTEFPGSQSVTRISTVGTIAYLKIMGTKLTCSEDVKKLSIDQRQCVYPDELRLRYFEKKYSGANCLLDCEEQSFYKLCGCVPFSFSFTDKPTCNISKIPCLQDIRKNQLLHETIEKCDCPTQCENVFYQVLSTSTKLRYKDSYSMMAFENITVLNNYNLVNIFFLSNRQTILVRDAITSTIYLLSSFGGVYSLFLGCSLITIVEIIYNVFIRYLINLKLFSTNIDRKKSKKHTGRDQRFPFNNKHETRKIQHVYGNNNIYW